MARSELTERGRGSGREPSKIEDGLNAIAKGELPDTGRQTEDIPNRQSPEEIGVKIKEVSPKVNPDGFDNATSQKILAGIEEVKAMLAGGDSETSTEGSGGTSSSEESMIDAAPEVTLGTENAEPITKLALAERGLKELRSLKFKLEKQGEWPKLFQSLTKIYNEISSLYPNEKPLAFKGVKGCLSDLQNALEQKEAPNLAEINGHLEIIKSSITIGLENYPPKEEVRPSEAPPPTEIMPTEKDGGEVVQEPASAQLPEKIPTEPQPYVQPEGDMPHYDDPSAIPNKAPEAVSSTPIEDNLITKPLTEADKAYTKNYDRGTPIEATPASTEPAPAITTAPTPTIDPEVERKRAIDEEDARRAKEVQDSFYTARSSYANRQAQYLNAKREKQGRITRVLTDLGITSGKVDEGVAREHLAEVKAEEAKYNYALRAKFQYELTKRKQAWGDEWDRARVGAIMHDNEEKEKFLDMKQKEFLIDESLDAHKELAEQMANGQTRPEIQRSWYTKALIGGYRAWQKTPRYIRYGVVAFVATGIAFGGGAIGVGGALGYFGVRVAKSAGIGLLTPRVYKGISAVGTNRADKKMGKSLEKAKTNFTMERFNEFQNELQEATKKNARSKRISKLVALGASATLAGVAGYEAAHHNIFGSTPPTETHTSGLATHPKGVPSTEHLGGSRGSSGTHGLISPENHSPKFIIGPETPAPEAVNVSLQPDSYTVGKNGSVSASLTKMLTEHPNKYGYDPENTKFKSVDAWAKTTEANLRAANPKINLSLVHAGDKIYLTPSADGNLPRVGFENTSGYRPGALGNLGMRASVNKIGFIPEADSTSTQVSLDPRMPATDFGLNRDGALLNTKPTGTEVNPLGTPYSEIETPGLKLDPNDAFNTRPTSADVGSSQINSPETIVSGLKLNPGEDFIVREYFTNIFPNTDPESIFRTIKNVKISDILQDKSSPLQKAVEKMVESDESLLKYRDITVGQYVEKLAKFTNV